MGVETTLGHILDEDEARERREKEEANQAELALLTVDMGGLSLSSAEQAV